MKYRGKKLENLCLAALLHDIGMTLLPKEVLNKPDKLDEMEYAIVKNHCQMGASLLRESSIDQVVSEIILQHHERLDGSGYPYGLMKDEIMEEAKIVMEAEFFDAATTSRPYKKAKEIEDVMDELVSLNDQFENYIGKYIKLV